MQLIAEVVFVEAALRLAGDGTHALALEDLAGLDRIAFDWVINGEKNVDYRFVELHRDRDRVRGGPQDVGRTHRCPHPLAQDWLQLQDCVVCRALT